MQHCHYETNSPVWATDAEKETISMEAHRVTLGKENKPDSINSSIHSAKGDGSLAAYKNQTLSCLPSPVSATAFFDAVEDLGCISLSEDEDCDDEFDFAVAPFQEDDFNESQQEFYKNQLTSKRRIRFKCDESGEIDEDLSEHSFPDYEITPELVEECWYSKKDRKNNKLAIPSKCRRMINPQYRRATMQLGFLADQHDCLEQVKESVSSQAAIGIVTHPSARGFEKVMASQMMIPRKPAKYYAREVLMMQEMLYDDLEVRTVDEISEEIAEMYKLNAENSVHWALMVAYGDAVYASELVDDVRNEAEVER